MFQESVPVVRNNTIEYYFLKKESLIFRDAGGPQNKTIASECLLNMKSPFVKDHKIDEKDDQGHPTCFFKPGFYLF